MQGNIPYKMSSLKTKRGMYNEMNNENIHVILKHPFNKLQFIHPYRNNRQYEKPEKQI